MDMHRPAIVLGTAEALVSRALNRGLGNPPDVHPIEFALLTNGAHWVIDDRSTVHSRRPRCGGCCRSATGGRPRSRSG